jgi:hypothetical protein
MILLTTVSGEPPHCRRCGCCCHLCCVLATWCCQVVHACIAQHEEQLQLAVRSLQTMAAVCYLHVVLHASHLHPAALRAEVNPHAIHRRAGGQPARI